MLKRRPPTCVYSTRADLRTIAALAEYFTSKNLAPQSISQLVRLTVEAFTDLLETQGKVTRPKSTAEAVRFLENLGLMGSVSPRGKRALVKQLQIEALELDGSSTEYLSRKGPSRLAKDQFERAKELLKQKMEKSGEVLGAKLGEVKKDEPSP